MATVFVCLFVCFCLFVCLFLFLLSSCLRAMSASRSPVSDGRVAELNVPTLADQTQQHPDGLVGTRVSLATPAATAKYADMEDNGPGAIVPSDASQRDDAGHHDSLGAVFGSEGSVKGAAEGTWVNLPAGLMTKAAGQTRRKSSTLTADHGERAVHVASPELVDRADRGPSNWTHVSHHDMGDDLMDHGAGADS